MSRRINRTEIVVGLVVIVALGGFIALLLMAQGGPGYLTRHQPLQVIFSDGQGIRVGSPVRVAGIEMGRVNGVDLVNQEGGGLRAMVTISLPATLVEQLRQDVRVTLEANLTGQTCVNVISSGSSEIALVPGQPIRGVESSMFDPILEKVGLGPNEREDLGHIIAEVRRTVDEVTPRVRQTVGTTQELVAGLSETVDEVRPEIAASIQHIALATEQLVDLAPRIEGLVTQVDGLIQNADGLIQDGRPELNATLVQLKDITGTLAAIVRDQRPRIDRLVQHSEYIAARVGKTAYNAELLTARGNRMLGDQEAIIYRALANIRDASGHLDQFIQKVKQNPWVLNPLYKPGREEVQAQLAYDNAALFMESAKELTDGLVRLESLLESDRQDPENRQRIEQLYRELNVLQDRMRDRQGQFTQALRGARSRR